MANGAQYKLSVLLEGRNDLSKEIKVALADLFRLKTELAKLPKGGAPAPTGSGGSNPTLLREETRLLHEQARLRAENARAAGVEGRNKAQGARASITVAREETRLLAEQARLRRENTRTSATSEMAGLRAARERINLQRAEIRMSRDAERTRGNRFDRFNDTVRTGRNAAYVARETFDAVRGFTDPALQRLRSRERFRVMNFSEGDNRLAQEAITRTTRDVKGVRETDVQETLTNLVNTLGGVDEAIKFLPIASRYRANMEALYGDRYGAADVTKQIGDTFKALETLGIDRPTGARDASGQAIFTAQDQARMESYFNTIAQAASATGGEISGSEFRQFAKMSRLAGQGLTPEGLKKILPVVQGLGGASTGTALQTLYGNMVGGRIPAHKLGEWERMGLLDRSKVELNKQGGIKRLRPGAIPIADTLGQDPVGVADKLAAALTRKGIDITNNDQVNKQLMAMFGDRTGVGMMAQMINFRAANAKESRNYERSKGINETYAQLMGGDNPLGQFLQFGAAQTNLRAQAGEGLVKTGGTIAEQLADLMGQAQGGAKDNPALAAATIGVLSLGKASADAAGNIGSFGGMFGGGGPGGGGGGAVGSAADAYLAAKGAKGAFDLARGTGVGKGVSSGFGRFAGLARHPLGLAVLAGGALGYGSYKSGVAQGGVDTVRATYGQSISQLGTITTLLSSMVFGGKRNGAEGTAKDVQSATQTLAEGATAAGQGLQGIQQPADALPASFTRVGGAASSLASRLASLEIRPPTFGAIQMPAIPGFPNFRAPQAAPQGGFNFRGGDPAPQVFQGSLDADDYAAPRVHQASYVPGGGGAAGATITFGDIHIQGGTDVSADTLAARFGAEIDSRLPHISRYVNRDRDHNHQLRRERGTESI